MRIRTTTTGILAVLALTLTACSSSGDGDKPPAQATATVTATATPTTTPTVDRAAARQECINAWVDLLEADNASADNEPPVCEQVPGQSAQMYAEALRERNAANRERLENCPEADPTLCIEKPTP